MMGYEWARDCVHIPFGLVSLEEGTMSTRQGRVVFLEDVLNRAVEQTKEILTELMDNGIGNINVKYTGWYNGGLEHTAPAKLKIEKKVGGFDGFRDLVKFA